MDAERCACQMYPKGTCEFCERNAVGASRNIAPDPKAETKEQVLAEYDAELKARTGASAEADRAWQKNLSGANVATSGPTTSAAPAGAATGRTMATRTPA